MTQQDHNSAERLRTQMRAAFPDVAYAGAITPADGKTGQDYDEHEALYNALHDKPWSQIPAAFIRGNAHGLVLLTAEAFVAYLPAWLNEGLVSPEVAEVMVYTFYPDPAKNRDHMDQRMHAMSSPQSEVLAAFLAYCSQTTTSGFLKDHATQALEYVRRFRKPSS
jgi:hypothetical protein